MSQARCWTSEERFSEIRKILIACFSVICFPVFFFFAKIVITFLVRTLLLINYLLIIQLRLRFFSIPAHTVLHPQSRWPAFMVAKDEAKQVNTFDFAIPVGMSYEFNNFVLDARYNIGVTKVPKYGDGYTNVLQLTIGYKFKL